MTYKSELGRLGEDKACEYLINKGFRIIEQNFKRPWGELDIVAMAPDKTLVFVEVKTMSSEFKGIKSSRKAPELTRGFGGLEPEHQMTASKIKRFKRAASLYAGRWPKLIDDKRGWRLDLIALVVSNAEPPVVSSVEPLTLQLSSGSTLSEKSNGLTKNANNFLIRHYQNIG